MALVDFNWYVNSVGYTAVALRPNAGAVAAGAIRRQFTAPAVGSERCFVCIIAGTTAAATDATWVLTRGAKTTDGTVTWMECTGQAALNGDLTNTTTWAQVKAATPAVLGQIIKRSNNASYQICTTAGAMSASEPAFSDTAGVTTTDTTAVWTSLGPVGNFTGGQAPHARLASALVSTWFAVGNTVYVGNNHAESQATAISLSSINTATSLVGKVLCHNSSGSYPPTSGNLTTGATISTTAAANISWAASNSSFYVYGLTFQAGVGASATTTINLSPQASGNTQNWMYFDSCSFVLATTSATNSFIQVGQAGAFAFNTIVFNNTTVKFANVAQFIVANYVQFVWQNTGQVLVAGSSIPTIFMSPNSTSGNFSNVIFEALDLSQLTGAIWGPGGNASLTNVLIKDCKLNASATITTPLATGMNVQVARSDSAATAYKSARYAYEGTETTETSITRVGGSVDPTGQAQSRKIVTTANVQWTRPFRAQPFVIWNSVSGANVTVTVYGTINAGAVPNNDDIWMTVVYLGSSLTPMGTFARTNKANILAASAPLASDGSSWNGGGSGAGWSPFKLVAVLSAPQPGLAGYLHARIRVAKPSTTYYIDPQVVLS